uniref:RRM domain-containing protein n=1 Tax=Toxoplasma gondii (strain ATCC 50861 / VEG) TaxID=432359 RepID=A0A0F7UST6_TOXGV|nr:TPA: RRM domain-containing protein [Toxoplasma gondii VEG]
MNMLCRRFFRISSGTLSIISLLTQKCIRLQQAIFFVNFFALLHEISNLCVAVPREPNIKSFHRLIKNVINISAASVTAGSLYLWSPWHVVEMNEDDESQPGSGGGSNVNQSMHLGSKHKQRSKKTQVCCLENYKEDNWSSLVCSIDKNTAFWTLRIPGHLPLLCCSRLSPHNTSTVPLCVYDHAVLNMTNTNAHNALNQTINNGFGAAATAA